MSKSLKMPRPPDVLRKGGPHREAEEYETLLQDMTACVNADCPVAPRCLRQRYPRAGAFSQALFIPPEDDPVACEGFIPLRKQ